jgi:hypothetical protein
MDAATLLGALAALAVLVGGFVLLRPRQPTVVDNISLALRAGATPLPTPPKIATPSPVWRCLKDGLSIHAEILYRTGGPGTHEWHEVEVRELWGEPGESGSWMMLREVAYTEAGENALQRIALDKIMVLKDAETRLEERDLPAVARWLRLRAGGVNARDFDELDEFEAERAAIVVDKAIAFRRNLKPPVIAVVECEIDGQIAVHDVKIGYIHTQGGRPVAFSGQATRRRMEGKRAWTGERTFHLPPVRSFAEPPLYVLQTLRPAEGAAHVEDPAAWLVEQAMPKLRRGRAAPDQRTSEHPRS